MWMFRLVFLLAFVTSLLTNVLITVKRSNKFTDAFAPEFYYAIDTFTNPYGNSKYCLKRNALCNDADCKKCECQLDDTFFSLEEGCLDQDKITTKFNGSQCLKYQKGAITIPTADQNTFQTCQKIFLPQALRIKYQNCYAGSIWRNSYTTNDITLHNDQQKIKQMNVVQTPEKICVECSTSNCKQLKTLSGYVIKLNVHCQKLASHIDTCFIFKLNGTQHFLASLSTTLPTNSRASTTTTIALTTSTKSPTTTKTTTVLPITTTTTTKLPTTTSTAITKTTTTTMPTTTTSTTSKTTNHIFVSTKRTSTTEKIPPTTNSKISRLITVNRATITSDTLAPAFYHAIDTFTNPLGDSKFCSDRNAKCLTNECQKCACALDDTFVSISHGCLGREKFIKVVNNGSQCLEYHKDAKIIPTATQNTFQYNACQKIYLPQMLIPRFQHCQAGSIWRSSLYSGHMKLFNEQITTHFLKVSQHSMKLCITCQDFKCKLSALSGHAIKLNLRCLQNINGIISDTNTCFMFKLDGQSSALVDIDPVNTVTPISPSITLKPITPSTTLKPITSRSSEPTETTTREKSVLAIRNNENKSDASVGLIVGITAGFVVVLIGVVIGLILVRKKRNNRKLENDNVRYRCRKNEFNDYETANNDGTHGMINNTDHKRVDLDSSNLYYQPALIDLEKDNELYSSGIENQYMEPDLCINRSKTQRKSTNQGKQTNYNDLTYAFESTYTNPDDNSHYMAIK